MQRNRSILLLTLLALFSYISGNSNNNHLDSIRAVTSYNSGINFFRNSNLKEAIDSFNVSAGIRERLYSKSSYEYGIVQNALGITYRNYGNLDKAIECFLYAELAYFNELNQNNVTLARLYNNIGNVYFNKLNFLTASDYYKKSLNIFESQKEVDKAGIADINYSIANTYYYLKDYKSALRIIEENYSNAYSDTKILYSSLQSVIYQDIDHFENAYKSYLNTIELSENFYSKTGTNVILDYLNFATFLITYNKMKEAKSILSKASNALKDNNINDGIAVSFYYKTQGFLFDNTIVETNDINNFRSRKTANLTEAIKYYIKGIKALGVDTDSLSNTSFSAGNSYSLTQSLELLKLIADTYTKISDIYADTNHPKRKESLEKALEYYGITAGLIQQARKELYSDESKIQLAELEGATFNKIVQTAYKATEIETNPKIIEFAFVNAERLKASSVFDKLSDQLARENSLVPDSLTELERTLNYSITNQNEKLFDLKRAEKPNHLEIASADSMLFQLKKQRDELNNYLEKNYSDYYELKYADEYISSNTVHQSLNDNEVLIEYAFNETDSIPELYAFLFSEGNLSFHKIDIDSSFIKSIEETFRFMSNPAYLFTKNENSKDFCVAAHKLYIKLLYPFADDIQNKKITIIPDGKLNYLPFDAFLTEMPDTSQTIHFNTLPYLIKENAVNYAYSANLLFKFNRTKRKAKNKLLAFAPIYNSDTVTFENDKLILNPLPGVQREVDLISDEIRMQLFRSEDATEKNFREQSEDYDILHLAMHAFINDSLPAFSRLAFSQNNSNQPYNDGWLNTADVYNLDLNARLTVLSACNSGAGNLKKGEGVMSLARGFLYAGCPTIVMTLWEVEDNAGTKIMSSFYQNLKKGRPTDEALRLAKLSYLENANPRMAHPHYWLGYVSIGNAKPLFRSYDYYFFGLLVLALAGIAIDQFIRLKKARKNRIE